MSATEATCPADCDEALRPMSVELVAQREAGNLARVAELEEAIDRLLARRIWLSRGGQ